MTPETLPDASTAVVDAATATATTLTETAVTALTAAPETAAPVAAAFDMTNPTMVAMYAAGILAVVVKFLIDLLAAKVPSFTEKTADGTPKVKKVYVTAVMAICAAVAYAVAQYVLEWSPELSLIFAGGAGGSTIADLAHRTVLPKT